jgi:hypothetical protein
LKFGGRFLTIERDRARASALVYLRQSPNWRKLNKHGHFLRCAAPLFFVSWRNWRRPVAGHDKQAVFAIPGSPRDCLQHFLEKQLLDDLIDLNLSQSTPHRGWAPAPGQRELIASQIRGTAPGLMSIEPTTSPV